MSKQKYFNKIWDHFITNEAKRSVDSRGVCLYEAPDGSMCAVGLLMSKKAREQAVECGGTVYDLKVMDVLPAHFLEHMDFLVATQFVHDNKRFGRVKERPGMLRRLAAAYNLKVPD